MENSKDNIVPAYMKNKQENEQKNNSNNKTNTKKKKFKLNKKFYILIASIVLVIALIFGIIFLARVIKYSKYDDYCKKMDAYGLSEFFNNGKSTSFEKVTKGEAIKIILTVFKDIGNLDDYFNIEQEYKEELWINRAVELGLIEENEINEKNYDDKITYIEFITYFQKARKVFNNATLDTSIYPNFSDISNIQPEQLYSLSEMVSQKLIENSTGKIKPNRVLYKGELSKVTLDILYKYNLMLPEGKKYNVNSDKVPENSEMYTYILFDVAKETYEKEFVVVNQDEFKTPIEVYPQKKTGIEQIVSTTEEYFNTILNIDYETINSDEFKNIIEDTTLFGYDNRIVDDYINYVKQNKIKISGSAKAQLPILYHDGENYRLRMKLNFEILNSETNKNVLYYDLEQEDGEIIYDSKKYEFLIDAIIDPPTTDKVLMYLWENTIYNQKIDEKLDNITFNKVEVQNDDIII